MFATVISRQMLMIDIGGVIFPFFMNKLLGEVGFAGMVRYAALFIGILLAFACFLVTARLPKKKWNSNLKWVDFALFKDGGFALYTIGAYLVMFVTPLAIHLLT